MTEDAQQANSMQCDDCGAKLRNAAAAQIHAEKTEHQNFSESTDIIKPLTEAEKQEKLQQLREKLAEKRRKQAEEEIEAGKKNAQIERKKTQESSEIIEELKRKEELKQIAAKRREKEDDIRAKQRVREQLEQDKRDRAERAAREKAARAGIVQDIPAPMKPVISKDHSSARLQIKHINGKPIIRSWPKETQMIQVAKEIQGETNIAADAAVFKMFGKVIKGEQLQESLESLGLVPSASLQVS